MGFSDFHNKTQSPAKKFYRWKGGEGKLTYWDADAQEEKEVSLPFKFAVLEQTRRISGYSPQGDGVRFYSNEAVEYNDQLRVMRKEGDKPAEEVLKGQYADIKDSLPQGARLAVQLYVYNPASKEIEMITCQGASLGAFIEYSKKNRLYENYTEMLKGEEKKTGSVVYFPPVYQMSSAYAKEDMDALEEADIAIKVYLKDVHDRGQANLGENVDQTPAQYEGEASQEIVEEPKKDGDNNTNPVDFNAIPF